MKKLITLLLLVIGVFVSGYGTDFHLMDSLGVTDRGGNKFIIHQVDAGETLYALSRKYHVSIQEIKDANGASLSNLDIGQKVYVPIIKKTIDKNAKIHTVKSSETLFSISRSYSVTVDDLKDWNNLSGNSISVGQELIIKDGSVSKPNDKATTKIEAGDRKTHTVEESQTLYSVSRMYGVSTDQITDWNELSSTSLRVGQVLVVSEGPSVVAETQSSSSMLPPSESQILGDENAPEKPVVADDKTDPVPLTSATAVSTGEDKVEPPSEKVVQRGIAEVIEDSQNTKKYLALHRNAPVGTIMQVKNEMNSQTVFVRVVGPIPQTGDNGKLLLKISKKAYDRLGAVDNRFPVEVSYIP